MEGAHDKLTIVGKVLDKTLKKLKEEPSFDRNFFKILESLAISDWCSRPKIRKVFNKGGNQT